MVMLLLTISILVSGLVDYLVKYAADNKMLWLAITSCFLWIPLGAVWYRLYQLDKFMVLSMYHIFLATGKDVLISQILVGEKLVTQEILGCVLVVAGTVLIASARV